MLTTRGVVLMFSLAPMVLNTSSVSGQTYPNRPIRIIASDPGGNADFNARLIAQELSGALGQAVIVENRRGTIIAAETAAKATPDGYSLLALGSILWIGPLMQHMPYDTVRDFSPITSTTNSPSVLVVHPSVPVKSVKELIALAKAKPGELNYSSSAPGGSSHLAAELFKVAAGVNMVGVPYKAAGPVMNALIAGEVQLTFASAGSVSPHLKSGRLRALGVTSAEPSALFPGLPTVASSGLPGYESGSKQGLWAPAKTADAIIKRLNQEIVQILSRADVKERFLSTGAEAAPSSPQQFAEAIKSETARLGKLIRDTGIRVE